MNENNPSTINYSDLKKALTFFSVLIIFISLFPVPTVSGKIETVTLVDWDSNLKQSYWYYWDLANLTEGEVLHIEWTASREVNVYIVERQKWHEDRFGREVPENCDVKESGHSGAFDWTVKHSRTYTVWVEGSGRGGTDIHIKVTVTREVEEPVSTTQSNETILGVIAILVLIAIAYILLTRTRKKPTAPETPKIVAEKEETKKDMKYCVHCGAEIPKTAQYCSECGKKQ